MDDHALRIAIAELLVSWGFDVEQIKPRPQARTPDFLAANGGSRYVIELKTKGKDLRRLTAERQRLTAGQIVEHAEAAGRRNTQAGIIANGVKQIEALPPLETDFRVLWIHLEGESPDFQMDQFWASAYGTSHIIDLDCQPTRYCYYFYQSDFYRFRSSLDGIALTAARSATSAHGKLLINNLSPRKAAFLASALTRAFRPAVVDPERLEHEHEIYIADCDANRREPGKVIAYLQAKYGRSKLMNIDTTKFEVKIAIPTDGKGETVNDE